jgi:hypothetical protein
MKVHPRKNPPQFRIGYGGGIALRGWLPGLGCGWAGLGCVLGQAGHKVKVGIGDGDWIVLMDRLIDLISRSIDPATYKQS